MSEARWLYILTASRVAGMVCSKKHSGFLSISEAREKLAEGLTQGFNEQAPVLIEALPSIGKSRGVVEWAADTGNPLTVFTARHELFDQYSVWCDEKDLSSRKLPSFYNDCKTMAGEYGEEWVVKLEKVYREKGLLPGEIHTEDCELFGEPLPCQQEGDCPYFAARDFDPEEYDVLIGHYRHAHVPQRVEGRYVVFDEFPEGEFLTEYTASRVTASVSSYLDRHPDLPFDYVKDLREFRRRAERKEEGIRWFERNNPRLQRDVSKTVEDNSGDAHPDAAVMAYAILMAQDLDNRWEFARLPDGRTAVINPTSGSLTVLNRPNLEGAESVVALDGTPTVTKWRLMLGNDLLYRPVLSDDEKRAYLRDTLRIQIVQTTQAANHYSGRSAISVTPETDLVLFEAIGVRENVCPALITSRSAMQKYERYGLSEVVGETEHYGNLKGSNQFKDTRIGIVSGSPHYGDDYIKKWAALAGKSTSRVEATKGMEQDFGSFGNQILHGMRENEVLQAVMRFGRDGDGATVYVHTAALPEWVERTATVDEIRPWAKGMDELITVIREIDGSEWRTKDVTKRVSISEQQTRTHLNSLYKFGYVDRCREGRGYTWSDSKISEIPLSGHVEFSDSLAVAEFE